jgi:chromosome segregation ATPase
MPTEEERLQIVEYDLNRFKTETVKAYSEMAVEFVILKGLTEDSLKRLRALREQIDQQSVTLGRRLDRLETRLDDHAKDIAQIEITLNEHTTTLNEHTTILNEHTMILNEHTTRLNSIDTRLDGVDTRLDGIDTRLDGVDTRLDGIDTRLGGIENMLTQVLARLPEQQP